MKGKFMKLMTSRNLAAFGTDKPIGAFITASDEEDK
jgi:hypothetical protein